MSNLCEEEALKKIKMEHQTLATKPDMTAYLEVMPTTS